VSHSIIPAPLLQAARHAILKEYESLAALSVKRASKKDDSSPEQVAIIEFREHLAQTRIDWQKKGLLP
jgi:hypothetical protein